MEREAILSSMKILLAVNTVLLAAILAVAILIFLHVPKEPFEVEGYSGRGRAQPIAIEGSVGIDDDQSVTIKNDDLPVSVQNEPTVKIESDRLQPVSVEVENKPQIDDVPAIRVKVIAPSE